MKRTCIFLMVLLAITTSNAVETIDLVSGRVVPKVDETKPIRCVKSVEDGVEVVYQFGKMNVSQDPIFADSKLCKIDGFIHNNNEGEPAFLFRWDTFIIPDGVDVEVVVTDSDYITLPIKLAPARPFENESSKYKVQPIRRFNGFCPSTLTQTAPVQLYRERKLLKVGITPLQYNYDLGVTQAYSKISYKIRYIPQRNQIEASKRKVPCTSTFLKNIVSNWSEGDKKVNSGIMRPGDFSAVEEVREDYLIISTPKYQQAVDRFAEWKKTLGFHMHDSLSYDWTPTDIKQAVYNLYHTEGVNLQYILIIGDHEDVPGEIVEQVHETYGYPTETVNVVTDYYYGCMDDITSHFDTIPDIYRGRLPVSTLAEANVVVDKIINYEKSPCMDNSPYKRGLCVAYFQDNNRNHYEDTRMTKTSEDIRDYVLGVVDSIEVERVYYTENDVTPTNWCNSFYSNGESIPDSLKKPLFAWDGSASDIISAINRGTLWVLFRGHGESDQWINPHFPTAKIDSLSNSMLPVVFSTTCETGMFGETLCFAEKFLRKDNGGCVAIFAASHKSWDGYTDHLAEGMFDAIWPNPGLVPNMTFSIYGHIDPTPTPTYRLGQILDQGLDRMRDMCMSSTTNSYINHKGYFTFEVFHCFGDPSMMMYTQKPTRLTLECSRSTDGITVSAQEPVTMSFYNKRNGEVYCYYGPSIVFPISHNDVDVCVSAHNRIPCSFNVLCIQNEIISSLAEYEADYIRVGTSVTETKPYGDVIFNGGSVSLVGKNIIIEGNTTVTLGTEFEAKNP